jgi:hypothetical protein
MRITSSEGGRRRIEREEVWILTDKSSILLMWTSLRKRGVPGGSLSGFAKVVEGSERRSMGGMEVDFGAADQGLGRVLRLWPSRKRWRHLDKYHGHCPKISWPEPLRPSERVAYCQ